jgi:YVTN family beta-propeller protein
LAQELKTEGTYTAKIGLQRHPCGGMSDDLTIINTENGKALKTVPVGRVPHTILAN